MTNNSLTDIILQLKKARRAVIFCHSRPDGDALGAGLALTVALHNAGKHAVMCCEDAPPEKFNFLPAMAQVKSELPANESYDTFISVDCADVTRMGKFCDTFLQFPGTTVNIDHHISNKGFAKYNYVCECPASCELLTDLIF